MSSTHKPCSSNATVVGNEKVDPENKTESSSKNAEELKEMLPIRFVSTVVRGFGRGSSDLGIPTANLCRDSTLCSVPKFDDLPCGIYWGFARIVQKEDTNTGVYKAAVSIGFNPYYNNEHKTVEPHLIAPSNDPCRTASTCGETVLGDFYGGTIRLSVVGYLRPELPFTTLENLIQAIKEDIKNTEEYCDNITGETGPIAEKERKWVEADDSV